MVDHPHKLWRFHGGLHLEAHKDISTGEPVHIMRVPRHVVLPLRQHIGEAAEPQVSIGERVDKGQVIARGSGYISSPVHASTSGTVVAIEDRLAPHPSGLSVPSIVIETDGRDHWADCSRTAMPDYAGVEPAVIRSRVREAGIVGLGGAAFPTAVKLNPRPGQQIDTVILNGAECEPYITCDDMLMREQPAEILEGLRIIRHALQARRCLIGIEDNKPEAYQALCKALGDEEADGIRIVQVPTIYPAGGEKQLIKVLTGQEVPSQGLPSDIGIVCQNVGTAASIYRAVVHGQPMVSRVVTVTGNGVRRPRNLEVLLGTPIRELIADCGGYSQDPQRLIMGGPMMGFALHTDEVPAVKGTNCILVADSDEVSEPRPAMPCIRCGACTEACPANLLPQQLYWHARSKDFDKAQDYSLFDCIECGCCAYVCPSNLPLVQYYRFAKTEIWKQERDRQKADLARQRYELRLERKEREEREKAERHARKKSAVKQAPDSDKKQQIEAARERARQRKAARAPESEGGEEDDPEHKAGTG